MKSTAKIAIAGLLVYTAASAAPGQLAPGPYEILPFEEAFIIEAWYDLNRADGIADWSGWEGASWVSPHAYNGHSGTDFALETGTPIYAPADGEVIGVVNSYPENDHSGPGNSVHLRLDRKSPLGEDMELRLLHLLPNIVVTEGSTVKTGDLLAYSDNTGNSTSEHLHFQSQLGNSTACPFYNAHFKYPIMFDPNARMQVGHVVTVAADETSIRTERRESSATITTAFQGQMFFASYWHEGFYRVFIPNDTTNRGGWIRAIDCKEVLEGATIVQALPDSGTYRHNSQLDSPYTLYEDPGTESAVVGRIYHGGGRFAADEEQGGWYRIAIPGSDQWGWVRPDARMVVYPDLYNPAVNIEQHDEFDLPVREDFSELGRSLFGRAKFTRGEVRDFSPASPGGDGRALFLTDYNNSGYGEMESILVGGVDDRDYFVQCDVYFDYKPGQSGWERYGIFLRDDGFAGMDRTFEGEGASYAIFYDNDDGRVRALRVLNPNNAATQPDYIDPNLYIKESGWHTLRIEAQGDEISFFLDGGLIARETDGTYLSGPCGIGYSNHLNGNIAGRGAYFDNFEAGFSGAGGWTVY